MATGEATPRKARHPGPRRHVKGRWAPSYGPGDWAPAFLAHYADTGLVGRSAELAGVAHSSVVRRARKDNVFRADCLRAKRQARERLEAELERRAVSGWDETTTIKRKGKSGKLVIVEQKTRHVFSDALLKLKLQAEMPEKYGPRSEVTVTHKQDEASQQRAARLKLLETEEGRSLLARLAELALGGPTVPVDGPAEPLGGEDAGVQPEPDDHVDGTGEAGARLPAAPLGDGGGPDA